MTDESANPRRPSRRKRKRPEIDHSVPSPCVKICRFSGAPFCDGCFRNIDEIREWMIMSREEKLSVLDNIAERKRSSES